MKLSLVSMFRNNCLHANHKKLTCKDILISSNVSECHYFFSFLFSLISFFLSFLYLTGVQRQECGCATRASSRESGIQGHCTDCGYSSPWAPRVGYQEQVWFQSFITNWLVVSDCNTLIELELSSDSRWLLVGSSSFCIQHYPCSVSLQGMLRGSAKLWRNKHSLLAWQVVLEWVWPSMNRNRLLYFIQSQIFPPSMHYKWKEIIDIVCRATDRIS
jgi:hypothetical protein